MAGQWRGCAGHPGSCGETSGEFRSVLGPLVGPNSPCLALTPQAGNGREEERVRILHISDICIVIGFIAY